MTDARDDPPDGLPPELDPRGRRGRAGRGTPPPGPGASAAAGQPGAPAAGRSPAGSVVAPAPARRRGVRRVLSIVALSLSALLFLVSGIGYALYDHFDGRITRIAIGEVPGDRPQDAPRGALNILMIGSDSRDFQGGEAFQGTGDERITSQRSDTMILAHLYGDTDKAQLVSLPRDSRVTLPAYTDSDGKQHAESKDKLNAALERGGPALLIATVEKLSGIKVDHFVSVDFKGFQDIVEELDGVEVCLTQDVQEKDSGIDLKAGRQVVRGAQALAYVRQRNGSVGNELGRIKRQQQFLGSIAREVFDAKTLANPLRLNGVLTVATNSLTVGDDLTSEELRDLALRLRAFDSADVLFTTVPVADADQRIDGVSYVEIDEEKAPLLFGAVQRDEEPGSVAAAPRPPAAPPLIVRPAGVRTEVYNGTGTAGRGRQVAQELAAVGFNVVGTPGDRGQGVTRTVVRHGIDKADSARTLAAAIPGSTTEQDPALGRTLEVVVGSDYTTARQVTVRPGAGAPSSPAPTTERVTTAAEDICGA